MSVGGSSKILKGFKRNVFWRLFWFIRPYWFLFVLLILLIFADAVLQVGYAEFMARVTDAGVLQDSDMVRRILVFGGGVSLLMVINVYAMVTVRIILDNRLRRDLKLKVFEHVLRLPSARMDRLHSGDLVSRLTNDINSMGGAAAGNLLDLVRRPISGLVAFIYLLQLHWQLAVLCGSIGPAMVLMSNFFAKAMRENRKRLQQRLGEINGFLQECFSGHMVVRAFCLEEQFYRRYSNDNQSVLDLQIKEGKLTGGLEAGSFGLGLLTFIIALGLGSVFVASGQITVGILIGFIYLVQRVVGPFTAFSSDWGRLQNSLAAAERIFEILDLPTELEALPSPRGVKPVTQGIEMRAVSFAYDEGGPNVNWVLDGFTASIPQGSVTALVGPSGVGKSTVFKLILGLYRPQFGEILVDGVPVSQYDPAVLRSLIALVPQDTILFEGSVRENIEYGRPGATDQEIQAAAIIANAHDFIVELPEGYDTNLGERGVRLSGGQRQRIAIARALLKDAPILLLDEATSSLDLESEAAVHEALDALMRDRTTLVIAHRLTTIQSADQILVMERGRIVESGTHVELIQQQGLYRRLYELQFKKEEGATA